MELRTPQEIEIMAEGGRRLGVVLQRLRAEVKPGMTGWAQVNGRNALSWEQKFELDVWYVDHQGFWLDVKILWLTVLQVLRRDGISQAGHATMPEFVGSPALRTRAK